MPISYGSVCSGIEAATTAWHPLGWSPRWFAEIEPFPSAVLAHHWPNVTNLGDFTAIRDKIATGAVEAPDILVGGTPCQAFSVAGLRQSLDDKRGQLTLEFVRLADAIDSARFVRGQRPVTVVWENVPGVLSANDNAFGCFLGALAGAEDAIFPGDCPDPGKSSRVWRWDRKTGKHVPVWPVRGLVSGPTRALAWRVLDAQWFGVAQRRRRVFLVASAGALRPEQVLFEFDGVRRDSPPRRETGKGATHDAAPCLTSGGRGVERAGETRGQGPVVAVQAFAIQERAAHPNLNAGPGGKGFQEGVAYTLEARHHVQACCVTGDVFHTLRAEGHDASEDGTGRGVGAVAIGFNARQDPDSWDERTGPLDTDGGTQAVAVGMLAIRGREDGSSLEARYDGTSNAILTPSGGRAGMGVGAIHYGMQVRRLTPTECERLQGFPDGHTRIPWPVKRDLGHAQCAKQVVRATVRTPSGIHFVATNHTTHVPAGGCPRAGMPTGQGYDLCRSVCGQDGHAEANALRLAGKKARGSTLYIEGHTYACEECRRAADAAGIAEIVFGPPPAEDCPDGPRYKALGNSMAVPVMRWIGSRIALQMEVQA